jgi:fumarate reductase flavoprotein subunit
MKGSISRRDFVKSAALGIGAAAITGVGVTESQAALHPPKKWDKETDIIVAGAGGAGLIAAVVARESGAKVILLEKMATVGGSTIVSGGLWSVGPTSTQKEQGIEDSADLVYKDLMKANVTDPGSIDPALARAYADNCAAVYEWLKGLGVRLKFPKVSTMGGVDSVLRMHMMDIRQMVQKLTDTAKAKGVQILVKTAANRLVVNQTGRVIGLKAETGGKPLFIKAKKAVILTSGDFSANPKMLAAWGGPAMGNALAMGAPGNTGDGIKMAMDVGSDLRLMYMAAKIEALGPADSKVSMPQLVWDGAVLINKLGKRYVNESLTCVEVGEITVKQPDGVGFIIYDKDVPKAPSQEKRDRHVRLGGKIYEAQTLKDLENQVSVPGLTEAVGRYNDFVDQGNDPDFGRVTLQGKLGKPIKIQTPPFYAIPVTGGMYFSSAGIKTDEQARVQNCYGEAIPGLYAAGQIRGRFVVPFHLGQAFVFGYLAGKKASKEKS